MVIDVKSLDDDEVDEELYFAQTIWYQLDAFLSLFDNDEREQIIERDVIDEIVAFENLWRIDDEEVDKEVQVMEVIDEVDDEDDTLKVDDVDVVDSEMIDELDTLLDSIVVDEDDEPQRRDVAEMIDERDDFDFEVI